MHKDDDGGGDRTRFCRLSLSQGETAVELRALRCTEEELWTVRGVLREAASHAAGTAGTVPEELDALRGRRSEVDRV
ncbi:MAG: hypothetical protein EP330_26330 [Deltaproteobacteria bacterium]|nr:MAG: hypothetical protein EP330_26330 [Deltaproteobacteria bacterium]